MPQIPNGFSVPMMKYDVISQLGLLNSTNYTDYIDTYPSLVQDSYIMKAEASGASKYTPTKKWKQWLDTNKPLPAFKVTAAAAGGSAGAAVTATLTAASHMTGATNLSPISVGQVYEDDKDGIQYEVRAVNKTTNGAHTVTLAPTKASQTAALTTASFLKFQGRTSVQEASFQQDGIYQGFQFREKDLQIIRTNKAYSDLSKFEIMEYKGVSYYTLDRTKMEPEHIMSQELVLMFGDTKDNMAATGNANTGAKGFIPTILSDGTDLTATTALSTAFFQDLKRANDADGYTTKYDVLCDTEFWIAYQAYLQTLGGGASNIVVNVSVDEATKKIRGVFDFSDEVKIYGIDISLKNYAYFNSARTHGADMNTGFWRGSAVFLPIGTRYNDAAEGELPYFRVRYMSDSEGGQRTFLDTDGALFGKSTTREAQLALTSYKGIEMYNVKAFKFAKIHL